MPGGTFLPPKLKRNAVSVAAAAATSTSAAFSMGGIGDCYALILEVTAASGTTPTLDVVVQSSLDGGTNYIDLPLRFAQKTAAGSGTPEHLVFKLGLGGNEVALGQATADTGGSLAKNCIFDPNFMKVKYTIGGTNPSFTFAVSTAVLPPQRIA